MTDGGSGYSTTPTVTFSSPGVGVGSTALAYAVLNGDSVSEIRITSAGVGYTQIPTITISDPPLIASGEYVFNEIIVGTSSSTTNPESNLGVLLLRFWRLVLSMAHLLQERL